MRSNLSKALPLLELMAANIPVRTWLTRLAVRRNWPPEVVTFIDRIEDRRLVELEDKMIDAEKAGDWSGLIEEAKSYPAFLPPRDQR